MSNEKLSTKSKSRSSRRLFMATSSAAAAASFFIGGKALAADPEFVIKLGTTAPAGTPWEQALKAWKRRVKKATDGRVKIKAYWGGALGDEQTIADRVTRGGVQVYGGSCGGASNKVPELEGIELPYLFPTLKAADKALDSSYDFVDSMLNRRGLKLLFYSENGRRSIGLKGGFVKSPSDLKGKKMRSQQTDVHIDTWRGLGASPVPMPVTEVLSSLQTGVVDGFDNTPLFTFAASWYQAVDHFTLTQHSYQPGIIAMNKEYWESLPADIRTALLGDPEAEARKHRKMVRAMEPVLVQNFRNAGIAVHESTKAEKAAFAKATKSAHAKFRKKHSGDGSKMLAKFQAAM